MEPVVLRPILYSVDHISHAIQSTCLEMCWQPSTSSQINVASQLRWFCATMATPKAKSRYTYLGDFRDEGFTAKHSSYDSNNRTHLVGCPVFDPFTQPKLEATIGSALSLNGKQMQQFAHLFQVRVKQEGRIKSLGHCEHSHRNLHNSW